MFVPMVFIMFYYKTPAYQVIQTLILYLLGLTIALLNGDPHKSRLKQKYEERG